MRYQFRHSKSTKGGDSNLKKAEIPIKLGVDDILTTKNSFLPEVVEACVHSLIKRVVWERPSAPAICSWDGNLTYLQLDQASSKLAHQLIDAGVEPRSKAILCFEETCLAPIAVLGLMKAGIVSIAFDINLPIEQLRSITAKISASVVLSSPANGQLARELGPAEVEVIVLDEKILSAAATTTTTISSLPIVTPSDTLCVLFNPNTDDVGIAITHRELSSAITYHQGALGLTPESRVVDLEPYNSRVAWYSLLVLTCGGCLCIPSQVGLSDDIEASLSALKANSGLFLDPVTQRHAKLSRFVRLRHIGPGFDIKQGTTSESCFLANVTSWKPDGWTANGYTEYGCGEVEHRVGEHREDGRGEDDHGEDGHTNGYTNGHTNGQENGHPENEHTERHTNGLTDYGQTENSYAEARHRENEHMVNSYTENEHAVSGHTGNGHMGNSHTGSELAATELTGNGYGTERSEVESYFDAAWPEGPHLKGLSGIYVKDDKNAPLVFIEHKEQTETGVQGQHVRLTPDSNGSDRTTQKNAKPGDTGPQGPTISPFSLLSSSSSVDHRQARADAAQLCHVRVSQVLDVMPCTPLQQGLLALTTQQPGSYVARYVFDISKEIDTETLRRAWDQVVARNPILRTRFVSLPGFGVMQVILDEQVPWTLGIDINHQEQAYNGHAMGLGTPLMRLAILDTATDRPRQFILEIHHSLYDGISLPLLLKEAEHAYFSEPSQSLLPMTAFIKYIMDQDKAIAKAFWQKVFAGTQGSHFPALKEAYHPQPDSQMNLTVSNLDWGHGDFTPATIVRAAWSIVTANGAGANEALFGVTVTGRQAPVPDIELMTGPTIATVPVRIVLDWGKSFNQLLDVVQHQAVDMILFEQTGLQNIARFNKETALGSDFQSLLVVQPAEHGSDDSSRSFLSEVVEAENVTQKNFSTYAIVVECNLESDKVHLRFDFDSRVLGQQQMEHIAQTLEYTISQLSDSKRGNETLMNLHDDQWGLERIWTWNAAVPEPIEACIHDLISQRVFENPSALAVSAWDGDLTYKQLDDLSTNLSRQLSEKGVAGTFVPLLFEKSMFMPVAVLAVMKAGGACMAMDVKQPRERLCVIAAQANSSIILSSENNESIARQVTTDLKEVVVLGSNQLSPASGSDSLLLPVDPSSILYVVFTSGTTGTPKGVLITHRNMCSAIAYQQKALGYSNSARVLDFASCAFDVAWSNLFHTLTVGATLCIPSQPELENDLPSCLERYNVTYADLTPSLARIMSRSALSKLGTLTLGGEAVLPNDANLAGEDTKVINAYGPAECSPTTTLGEAAADGIGRGAGVCTWVVEPENPDILARVGSVGELYLEGPLVGEGYLNDPEKTAAVFVEDPAWLIRGVPERLGRPGRPGRRGRLYRTGDLVRYKDDGSLFLIGRKDTQVKIRGQRVELGEVEQHVLNALRPLLSAQEVNVASVQVTADTIKPKGARGTILAAFITLYHSLDRNMTEKSHAIAVRQVTDALTDRLTEMLPVYMVPTVFVPIYKLPILSSGKSDRRQLRAIGEAVYLQCGNDSDKNEPTESLSELEAILQQVWMSVLNVTSQEASVNTPFARLGGDSISAMQAVSQGRLHNIAFTISDLLKAKTIRKLAACCQVISRYTPVAEEGEDEGENSGEPFEISPIQHMFFDAYPDGLNQFNQSFILELRKETPVATLNSALHAVVQRHSLLRARFSKDPENGLWMQKVAEEGDTQSYSFTEHSVDSHDEIAKQGQLRQESLDIERGPLFGSDLFNIPHSKQILILSAHHLIIDLVSWRIIWNDIEEFIIHGKLLSQPTTSFRTWCRRQTNISRNLSPLSVLPYSVPEPQLDFWGLPSPENTFGNVETYSEFFDEQVSDTLFGNGNESLRTEPVDIVIGTMVHSFLQTFPERATPVVWMEGHGREPSDDLPFDVSKTVGWFTTISPIPVNITPQSSVVDAIRTTKDTRCVIPGKGRPYFACRYHSESGREAFQGQDVVELLFNFTGRYQQLEGEEGLFTLPDYLRGQDSGIMEVATSAGRPAMIEIDAHVEEGRFAISFNIHKKLKHQDRIRAWIEAFTKTLETVTQDLVRLPQSFTLSDLPLLPLSYSGLDTLLMKQLPTMGIEVNAVADIYPCSPLQEGMLLSLFKGTATYATFSVWKCVPTDTATTISPSRLEAAWKTVVNRHTILQSVFCLHPEGNGFVQIILPGASIRVTHITVGLENPSTALERLEKPIFSANEPEHAFTICQSGTGEVACRLDANHILVDAASMGVIEREVIAVYDNCGLQPAPAFSKMIQYINSTSKSQRIASWAKLLDGVEPCEFPTSQAQPEQTTRESCSVPIPDALASSIADICKKLGIARSVFLQVAWAMTLSQLTAKSEVCFGYLASGRDSPVDGVETIVGPLANLLVSRIDLRAPARQVLEVTSERSIEHLGIQHASLAEIQHQLGLSGRTLFNTTLAIQATTKSKISGEERSFSFESHDAEDSHEYDLSLNVSIDGNSMSAVVEFRAPFVSPDAAQEAVTIFSNALQYLATNTDDIDILASEESLSGSFFKVSIGADEQLTRAFWKSYFANIQGSHFPPLKAASYQPRPTSTLRLGLQGLEWANRGEFTAATILRAAWSILASRILGSNEVLFGATVTDHKMVVPVRIFLDLEASVTGLLLEVQRQAIEMATFERTGLRRIRSISEEASLGCDFQMLLHVMDEAGDAGANQAVLVENTGDGWQQSFETCAMVVECQLQTSWTDLCIKFDPAVVGELQATRICHQFEHILHQLLSFDLQERKLRDLVVASPRDVNDIWAWNSTASEPVEACVHEWIIRQAREHPLAPAINAWDGDLRYGQLLELSTNLSYELVKKGVGPGTIVPLCFEKSMWMPVAALAVIQAGAAVVALDSASQPEERIRAIATKVKATVILSSTANEALVRRLSIDVVVVVGPDQLSVPASSQTYQSLALTEMYPKLPTVDPSQLLCVIFTSGSTGAPKGAKLLHRNYCSAIAYQRDALGYIKSSRVLDFSSYAFDVVWANLFNTLTAGGCLCIPSSEERQNDLPGCLEKYKITTVDLPPSMARHTAGLSNLTTLILGGEAVLPTDVNLAGDKTQIRNAYGPAECTPTATIMDLTDVSDVGLGRGVGVCTWVTEPDNPETLAPIGAVGELWIEGPMVGDGYLDDPMKTAAAFVQDPTWLMRGIPGQRPGRCGRVYRTGDLVQYREDGSLLFMGRKDTQVKIRGQRVELEEVEHYLRQAIGSNVMNAQVIAETIQPHGMDSKILATFVSLDCASEQHDAMVKEATVGVNNRLAKLLPPFMIPSIYMPLQEIPRTITGKIDRRQLQVIGSSLTSKDLATLNRADGERQSPRSDMERLIQGLWAEVLNTDPDSISIEDSFMRIGGDSIGAMRLVGMARQKGLSLTIRDIFQNPILCDLAAVCA